MKLFRGIRRSLIKEGNLKRYIPYAIGEILLVMIGILLAFQVSKWNDNRIKRNSELIYYQNIKEQIINDKNLILNQIEFNNQYLSQFKFANIILETNNRSELDTLGQIIKNLTQFSDFDRKGNIYETLVNSGEIKLLKNNEIVNIIRILEERYNYVNRMENMHQEVVMYSVPIISEIIKFSSAEIMQPEKAYSYQFQNIFQSMIGIMEEKNHTYSTAINFIDDTLELIDKELENK
jgi:hypothetical protein